LRGGQAAGILILCLPRRQTSADLRAANPASLQAGGESFLSRQAGSPRQRTRCTKQRMRILLQQKDTGLYFRDMDSWTSDSAEAMDFVSSTSALEFCARNRLAGVQLVLKFDGEKFDIVLPPLPPQPGQEQRPAEWV
jgi:hypothetical protein